MFLFLHGFKNIGIIISFGFGTGMVLPYKILSKNNNMEKFKIELKNEIMFKKVMSMLKTITSIGWGLILFSSFKFINLFIS